MNKYEVLLSTIIVLLGLNNTEIEGCNPCWPGEYDQASGKCVKLRSRSGKIKQEKSTN